jgi:hypothetical protein
VAAGSPIRGTGRAAGPVGAEAGAEVGAEVGVEEECAVGTPMGAGGGGALLAALQPQRSTSRALIETRTREVRHSF